MDKKRNFELKMSSSNVIAFNGSTLRKIKEYIKNKEVVITTKAAIINFALVESVKEKIN